jgi:putative Mg2+ transporter-C (MgtC) family protein
VTTAATLWFVTVVGLCFGGGQIYIGIAATLLGTAVLWIPKDVDRNIPRAQHARLTVVCRAGFPLDEALKSEPLLARLKRKLLIEHRTEDAMEASYDLRWHASSNALPPVDFIRNLLGREGILSVEWRAGDAPSGESKGTDATALRPNWLRT